MRIKKIAPVTPANGNIKNSYGTSQTDTYSQKYENEHNVIVSADTPTTDERVWFKNSKNLLDYKNFKSTKTQNGITFTNNNDGTITINGTATANANFSLLGEDGKQYKIIGNYLYGGINANIRIRIIDHSSGNYHILATSTGSSVQIDTSTYTTGYIELSILSGTTCNNVVITPMITEKEDNDYEPYITPSINVDNEEIYSTNYNNYSINEIVVGQFLGKPLYRKVIQLTTN